MGGGEEIGFVRAWLRLIALALVLAALLPVHLATRRRSGQPSPTAQRFVRVACRLLSLRATMDGVEAVPGPVLLVSNHISWADIFVLGAAFPASFVAKSEVAGWPVLGWLVAQHGTIFVDRGRRSTVGGQRDAIADRLRGGSAVLLFPEGTSSDGRTVLPFKPALLAAAADLDLPVQPLTIAWIRVGGRPVDERNRRTVAWIDDMVLLPHIWALLRAGGAEARIVVHPALAPAGRHLLAERSRASILSGLPAS